MSSHMCLGGWDANPNGAGGVDLGSVDAPWPQLVRNQKERTCVFRNVCFDGRDGVRSWVYYAQNGEFAGARRVHPFGEVQAAREH